MPLNIVRAFYAKVRFQSLLLYITDKNKILVSENLKVQTLH